MTATRTISLANARRLAVTKQLLAGPRVPNDKDGILETVRGIGCLQLDPISAVARNHLLVLWSRLGNYDPKDLDTLMWEERKLFEYWAHAASIVLTEDFPLYERVMGKKPTADSTWGEQQRQWLEENKDFREYVLSELREKGALQSKDFEDESHSGWSSSGWTGGRNVSRMLDFLWVRGEVFVSTRKGGQRFWDLAERVLPDWTPHQELSPHEGTYIAAQRSLRMLGVGTSKHITYNFTRSRYPHLQEVLRQLEREGRIEPVQVVEDGRAYPGTWYLHIEDIPVLAEIEAGDWQPRTTLLSPFDNLIADRDRTERLFDYKFRIEIYVPKHLRQYGYYVLSILHGDRIIGRIDPLMDRKGKRLAINAVHAEPHAPMTPEAAQAVAHAVSELAAFLGAKEVTYTERVPDGWRDALLAQAVGNAPDRLRV
ncbi:MAG TPA: crosslink repair DNA glycosylase YcaQ family protein [Chloroflexia bacterium]|nr:crosslink repair DNA glycosylase YcaQ family protein [Chloroflexia bacterium]